MNWLILMFVTCGIAFGLSNKLPERLYFTKDGDPAGHFFARMFRCAFCTGFWAGVFAKGLDYLHLFFEGGALPLSGGEVGTTVLIYGMSGAAFNYLFHCATVCLENLSALAESRFHDEN